jgi:hypothetical protein
MTRKRRSTPALPLAGLGKLRELLEIIAALRAIEDPFSSPAGLRQAVKLLLRLAGLIGVDQVWLDRVRPIVEDDAVLRVVLAVVQYVLGRVGLAADDGSLRAASSDGDEVVVDAQALIDWLPLVVQLIRMILELRGER